MLKILPGGREELVFDVYTISGHWAFEHLKEVVPYHLEMGMKAVLMFMVPAYFEGNMNW